MLARRSIRIATVQYRAFSVLGFKHQNKDAPAQKKDQPTRTVGPPTEAYQKGESTNGPIFAGNNMNMNLSDSTTPKKEQPTSSRPTIEDKQKVNTRVKDRE
jgi:hypothetical protein